MSNFYLRLGKKMIVKISQFSKKIIPAYAHQREIPLPLVQKRKHFFNSPSSLACVRTK